MPRIINVTVKGAPNYRNLKVREYGPVEEKSTMHGDNLDKCYEKVMSQLTHRRIVYKPWQATWLGVAIKDQIKRWLWYTLGKILLWYIVLQKSF